MGGIVGGIVGGSVGIGIIEMIGLTMGITGKGFSITMRSPSSDAEIYHQTFLSFISFVLHLQAESFLPSTATRISKQQTEMKALISIRWTRTETEWWQGNAGRCETPTRLFIHFRRVNFSSNARPQIWRQRSSKSKLLNFEPLQR